MSQKAERTNNMEILAELLRVQQEKEDDMNFRHPWFNVVYNYIVAATALALVVSLIVWGLDIRTERKANEMTATAIASYQAELQAAEDAKAQELAAVQASEEYIIQQEAKEVAKAFYGIRRFIERYGYSEKDLETYARCMFNRSDAAKTSLQAIISKPEQFLGYSDENPVLDVYFQPALQFVTEWHNEEVKPCDSSYQFAELTERGIYLVNEFGADGYAVRYHA